MKRCPECRRDYFDDSLLYCLDDGSALLEGPDSRNKRTAILSERRDREDNPAPDFEPTKIFAPKSTDNSSDSQASGRKRKIAVAASVVFAAAAFVASAYFYYQPGTGKQVDSLAVLPFANETGDAGLDYLSDGLSESLIDKLSQLPGMKVIARGSSFKYRGPDVNIQEIASKLNIDAVVMGKVSKAGDQFAIRVEVVDAADNKQIWGEQYVRRDADLISLQQEIARSVSDKLQLKLSDPQNAQLAKRETTNPKAHELFMLGRYWANKGGNQNSRKALDLFQQAVEIDPGYARAYAALSGVYTTLVGNVVMDPTTGVPKAEAAARKAVELDPTLSQGYSSLGRVLRNRWKWQEAEIAFKRSIELDPNSAAAHRNYGFFLSLIGRGDEAVSESLKARELDPISLGVVSYVGYIALFARRYDEGIEASRKTIEMDPNYANAHGHLAYNLAAKGMHREAIESYKKIIELGNDNSSNQIYLGASYVGAGDRSRAVEILSELRSSKAYVSPTELAILLAALGMKDEAFASLEKGFAARDPQLEYLRADPAFDPLRDDPRFVDLIRRVGFP